MVNTTLCIALTQGRVGPELELDFGILDFKGKIKHVLREQN